MSFLYNSDTDYLSVAMDWTPTALTCMAWYYPTSVAAETVFVFGVNDPAQIAFGTSWADTDDIEVGIHRVTTNSLRRTTGLGLTANKQHFVVFTYSDTNGVKIFHGDLSTIASECSYTGADAGAGAVQQLDVTLYLGNRDADDSRRIVGDLSMIRMIDAELTLGQIRKEQFRPRPHANERIFYLPGLHGASACPDLSGNGNTPTINGLTVGSNPVPLGPLFGNDIITEILPVSANAMPMAMQNYRRLRSA